MGEVTNSNTMDYGLGQCTGVRASGHGHNGQRIIKGRLVTTDRTRCCGADSSVPLYGALGVVCPFRPSLSPPPQGSTATLMTATDHYRQY